MLGIIPTVCTYSLFSSLFYTLLACNSCPTLFIVTLDLFRALSETAQELTCGGIIHPLEVGMSLQTQNLRLAGERAGRWNEVGDIYGMLKGMCSNYQVVIVTALVHLCNYDWLC